jgi:hypothetical protein
LIKDMDMSAGVAKGEGSRGDTFAPLREPTFRRIWTASLISSFGHLILGVGAAWEMTRLSGSPSKIALVQTAMMLPLMLVALPAGAVADMFDRRKIALAGLGFSVVAAARRRRPATAGYRTRPLWQKPPARRKPARSIRPAPGQSCARHYS